MPQRKAPSGPQAGAAPREKGFRVRATQLGYFNEERKRPGDVFDLKFASQFSKNWMERVHPRQPLRQTTGQDELRKAHDETLKQRASGIPTDPDTGFPEGGDDPLGADDGE